MCDKLKGTLVEDGKRRAKGRVDLWLKE